MPGAIAAAFIASVIVYCVMLNVEKNALSAYEKGTVLTAVKEIPQGTLLHAGNAEQYFAAAEIDKRMIPDAAIVRLELLEGMMTAADIDSGSVLTHAMVNNLYEMVEDMEMPVTAGFKADDLYQVVSGTLRSGDRIHIYTVDEELGTAYLLWENILIEQVFDSAGAEIIAEDSNTAAQRVNILMEQENVERFYSELAVGSIRVVKVWPQ